MSNPQPPTPPVEDMFTILIGIAVIVFMIAALAA